MKKIYFILFLIFFTAPMAMAQEQFTEGKLVYEPVTVDGIEGWKIVEPAEVITGELVIPREVTHEGVTKPVLEIGEEAFTSCDEDYDFGEDYEYVKIRSKRCRFTSLSFEAGSQLRLIDRMAFYGDTGTGTLSGTIIIPATVTFVAEDAFNTGCQLDAVRFEYGSNIKTLYLSNYNTRKLYVPRSVNHIDRLTNGDASFSSPWTITDMYLEWETAEICNPVNYPNFLFESKESDRQVSWLNIGKHTIHVLAGTKEEYEKTYWKRWYFTIEETTLDEYKEEYKAYLDDYAKRYLWDDTNGAVMTAAIAAIKDQMDAASSRTALDAALESAKVQMLPTYKADRIDVLRTLSAPLEEAYVNKYVQPVIDAINASITSAEVRQHYESVLPALYGAISLNNQAEKPIATGDGARLKITKTDGTVWEFDLSEYVELSSVIEGEPLVDDSQSMNIVFSGEGCPIETSHYLEGSRIGFTADGETMKLTVNGAEALYNINNVSALSLASVVPSVSLRANQDPDHAGNYYTTFYSSLEAYTLPEGVKAYTAEVDGDVIRMTPIEGNILPQGEAVLLYSNEVQDGNWTMEIADNDDDDDNDNEFRGVDVATAQDAANYYMLSYGQNKLGFYKMNPSTMLAANKAFIVQSSSPAKAFRMVFAEDEVDGIESINDDDTLRYDDDNIYSVSGVRLNKFQKGINIVNGKKIVVK